MVLGDLAQEVNYLLANFCQIWKIYDILMATKDVTIKYNGKIIKIDRYFIMKNDILYLVGKAQYYLTEINKKLMELAAIHDDINRAIDFQMAIQDYANQEDVRVTYNSIISVFEKLDLIK